MQALEKLKMDAKRYYVDHGIGNTSTRFLKLFLVVDFWPVLWFRLLEWCLERPSIIRQLARLIIVLHKPVVEGFSGARLRPTAKIGGGLLLHQSTGVVIASDVIIGENCTLYAGSCLVNKSNGLRGGVPCLGDQVVVLSGAKIVGPVNIGGGAIIGANAVVLKDVPEDTTVVGVPAKILGASKG